MVILVCHTVMSTYNFELHGIGLFFAHDRIMYLWSVSFVSAAAKPVASPSNTTLPKFSEAGYYQQPKSMLHFRPKQQSPLHWHS